MNDPNLSANIAAFFDIDGTLLPGPSLERRAVAQWIDEGMLGAEHGVLCLARFLQRAPAGWRMAVSANKRYLTGLPAAAFDLPLSRNFLAERSCFPEALERVRMHMEAGHRVFLISGTLAPLAHGVALELERKFSARQK